MKRGRQLISFGGIAAVNFLAMLLMCGIGILAFEMAEEFGKPNQLSLIITLEMAARCAVMPFSGWINEKIGKKRLYTVSVFFYIVSVLGVGFSKSFMQLCIFRVLSGISWGFFITNSIILTTTFLPKEKAAVFSGYLQTATVAAMAFGAPLAGILCKFGWRTEFYITGIILTIGYIAVIFSLPDDKKAAFPAQTESVSAGRQTKAWGQLFEDKKFVAMVALTLAFNIANASGNYLNAFVQSELSLSRTWGSWITFPGIVLAIITMPLISRMMTEKKQYLKTMLGWSVCSAAGFGIWWLCDPGFMGNKVCYLVLLAGSFISGIGSACSQTCPYLYSMQELPEKTMSQGVSIVGFVGAIGAVAANALCGVAQSFSGYMGTLRIALFPAAAMLVLTLLAGRSKNTR